jgi:hypothetical protein
MLLVLRFLVFWGVMLGGRVYGLQCFKGTWTMDPTTHEDEGTVFLKNICISKASYRVECPRRQN